ncbi:MAG: hypothetical protein JOZ39_11145 [Chloroflexi bacterium]|nr:hypothetical protein [Chloroflexota bacterium]
MSAAAPALDDISECPCGEVIQTIGGVRYNRRDARPHECGQADLPPFVPPDRRDGRSG